MKRLCLHPYTNRVEKLCAAWIYDNYCILYRHSIDKIVPYCAIVSPFVCQFSSTQCSSNRKCKSVYKLFYISVLLSFLFFLFYFWLYRPFIASLAKAENLKSNRISKTASEHQRTNAILLLGCLACRILYTWVLRTLFK